MAGPWEDYASQVSGPWDDYAPPTPTAAVEEDEEEGAKSLVGKAFGKPTAREELTVPGEFSGGLSDVAQAFSEHSQLSPSDPKRFLLGPAVLMGLIRSAASPLAPAFNLATQAGERMSDIASRVPGLGSDIPGLGYSVSDILAGTTAAIGDYSLPMEMARRATSMKSAAKAKFPLVKEQVAKVVKGGAAKEAEIVDRAKQAMARNETLRRETAFTAEAQETQLQDLSRQKIREAIEKGEGLKKKGASVEEIRAKLTGDEPPLTEAVGRKFSQETFPAKLKAAKEKFNKQYGDVIDEASKIEAPATNYQAKLDEILGEGGVSRPLATRAEGAAAKAKQALAAEDDAYAEVKAYLGNLDPAESDKALKKIAAQTGIDPQGKPTLDKLILERQRLKAAERAAYESGNENLGRQFKEMQRALADDIVAGSEDVAGKLASVDDAYRTEYVPFFSPQAAPAQAAKKAPESVLQQIIPPKSDKNRVEKAARAFQLIDDPAEREAIRQSFVNQGVEEASQSGAFDAEKFVGWWNKYSDPAETGDRVLKTALGERYEPLRDIVQRFKTVKPKEIDDLTQRTVTELAKRTDVGIKGIDKARIDRLKRLEGVVDDGEGVVSAIQEQVLSKKQITKTRDVELKALRKDIARKIEEITGKPFSAQRARGYGSLLLTGGIAGRLAGVPAGQVAIVRGGIMILAAEAVSRMLNSARPLGRNLLARGMRAVPGTAQASAIARQIQNFLQEEEGG